MLDEENGSLGNEEKFGGNLSYGKANQNNWCADERR